MSVNIFSIFWCEIPIIQRKKVVNAYSASTTSSLTSSFLGLFLRSNSFLDKFNLPFLSYPVAIANTSSPIDTTIATASISGTTLTITPGTTAGTTSVVLKESNGNKEKGYLVNELVYDNNII